MPPKTYFEELSYALRRRELLPRPLEEDGLLPVEWNGRILCRVTESGAVRYDPTWVDTSRAKAALAQATEAAGTVMEYMTLLENAPPLKADGLADGYRVLAEFNGTVLAGTETLLGAQFVTWARDYDRSGVNNGHYYMEDYQGAREDFALRSGLVARERVFDREQLEGLRQAVQGFLYGEGPPPTSRSSNAGASWIRSQPSCRKEPRIRCRAKVRSLDSPCEGGAKSGAAFFYAQILFHFCAHKSYAPEHPAEPPPRPVCTRSPLCVGCPYPANGFLCWGGDGKGLRSETRCRASPDRQVAQEVKEE